MWNELQRVADEINKAYSIALISHANPDGDTIGSTLALKLAIEATGKKCAIFDQDKIPDMFGFLPEIEDYCNLSSATGTAYDLGIAIDCSADYMMGNCADILKSCAVTAVIDHHSTNDNFCSINAVDGNSPATTLLIYKLLPLIGAKMTRSIAICLYTGASTDTGHFAYSYTNAEIFGMMEDLMHYDLPLSEIHRILFRTRTVAQTKLIARILSGIEFYKNGKITVTKISLSDMADCGAESSDMEGIINFGVDIKGVEMTAQLKEQSDGTVKVGFRSFEPYHVNGIAKSFGGGGHACAAGCTIKDTMENVKTAVEKEMEKELERVRV